MKVLRSIGAFILGTLLFIDIFMLSTTICFNNVVKKELLPQVVKEVVINEATKDLDNEEKEEFKEKLSKASEVEGFDELMDTVLNEFIECKKTGRELSDEALDKVFSFIEKNKSLIEEFSKEPIDMSKINTKENRDEIKKQFNTKIKEVNIPTESSAFNIIDSYSVLTSKKSIIYMLIIAIILTISIALVRWSYYIWMKDLSIPLIITGINIAITYFFLDFITKFVGENYHIIITIDKSVFIKQCIIEIVLGVVLFVVCAILDYKNKKVSEEL